MLIAHRPTLGLRTRANRMTTHVELGREVATAQARENMIMANASPFLSCNHEFGLVRTGKRLGNRGAEGSVPDEFCRRRRSSWVVRALSNRMRQSGSVRWWRQHRERVQRVVSHSLWNIVRIGSINCRSSGLRCALQNQAVLQQLGEEFIDKWPITKVDREGNDQRRGNHAA